MLNFFKCCFKGIESLMFSDFGSNSQFRFITIAIGRGCKLKPTRWESLNSISIIKCSEVSYLNEILLYEGKVFQLKQLKINSCYCDITNLSLLTFHTNF